MVILSLTEKNLTVKCLYLIECCHAHRWELCALETRAACIFRSLFSLKNGVGTNCGSISRDLEGGGLKHDNVSNILQYSIFQFTIGDF